MLILSLILSKVLAADNYNILSLDGSGFNGLVMAQYLDKLEQYAYNTSTNLTDPTSLAYECE